VISFIVISQGSMSGNLICMTETIMHNAASYCALLKCMSLMVSNVRSDMKAPAQQHQCVKQAPDPMFLCLDNLQNLFNCSSTACLMTSRISKKSNDNFPSGLLR